MDWKVIFLWVMVAAALAVAAWVRLAPSDPARWHAMPERIDDRDFAGGAMRVIETGPDGLSRLDAIARGWPHTRVLAGAVDDGMITYVTRTLFWGFPDYTTVRLRDGRLELYARLRFGRSDFGVNRARLEAWLSQI